MSGAKPEIHKGGGGCFGGLGEELPAARGHGGLEAESPALENFASFCKNLILGLF